MADEKADEVNVRYIVRDVAAAVEFYRDAFGFDVGLVAGEAFGEVRRGHLRLLLSGPGSSGARVEVDGRQPEPGGGYRLHHGVAPQARSPPPIKLCYRGRGAAPGPRTSSPTWRARSRSSPRRGSSPRASRSPDPAAAR